MTACIAIVGAGFSGSLLAVHLLRTAAAHVRLIEREAVFGPGRAYATAHPGHLLNVRAGRMSAFPDRPGHFLDWLRARPGHQAAEEAAFVPRGLYGAYLRDVLAAAADAAGDRFHPVRGEATALAEADCVDLHLADGRTLAADIAVLTTGNFAPLPPPHVDPDRLGAAYAGDPWAAGAVEGLDPDGAVLLVGTGLTMADAAVSLLDAGHRGPIHVLSRRGLLPRRHASAPALPPPPGGYPPGLMALLRTVRHQVRATDAPWQSVLDPLRPALAALWCAATPADRARFLRHLRPWWDAHRHRLPPVTADRLDDARARGQLRPHAGHIRAATPVPGGVRVDYLPRGALVPATLTVARLVNCVGPAADYDRIGDPLIRHLLDQGTVRPDELRLGLDIADDGALRRADGTASSRLFALGPVLRASVWEMTSVPDLRDEAERLAARLAGRVGQAAPR